MKMFLVLVLTMLGFSAFAGFQGYQSTTNLGLFQAVKCDAGVTCTKQNEKLVIFGAAGISPQTLATASTITASQCGRTFYNAGAVQMTLPKGTASLLGCRLTFVALNAGNYDVNPDNADIILYSTNVTGDMLRSAALGNTLTVQLMSATQWAVIGVNGTWADAN